MAQILMVEPRAHERSGEDKLDELYRAFAPDAVRLAYLLTGDPGLAEDLAQDAFVRVMGRFHDLRNPESFWWYLRKTVVNLSRSYFRHRRVERAFLANERRDREPASASNPDERWAMHQALMGLRPAQRAAVVLRYFEDLTEAQTAEVMGWPVGTVKSTVSRAMDRLRKELASDE
jgi:RNA polymerase sigma-70 factor (sigma-E family)